MTAPLPHPEVWRASELAAPAHPVCPTGWAALDAVLPGGGWPLGAVVELHMPAPALPWRLLLPALRTASAQGLVVLVGLPLQPHVAAWAAQGIATARLWRVQPRDEREVLWCAEQLLTCPDVALCWLHSQRPPLAWIQRLQQAAAAAQRPVEGTGWPAPLVVLSRPSGVETGGGSVAPLRLQVQVEGAAALCVRVLKRRGPPLAQPLHLPAPWPWSEWCPS
ncbi:MAG: cell division protein [Tepidimonas sp.]|uniref:cell division protein n=1 Tax=Tepidimonas sp. TaxID=2002775 RepID=UPI00298ED87E|nr:cell division protein [Tepidimonas sp.]MDW8336406.1 cell division protein [Tepidimonas sp.]